MRQSTCTGTLSGLKVLKVSGGVLGKPEQHQSYRRYEGALLQMWAQHDYPTDGLVPGLWPQSALGGRLFETLQRGKWSITIAAENRRPRQMRSWGRPFCVNVDCAQVTVGRGLPIPPPATEPDVTVSRHPAPEQPGHCHWHYWR